MDTQAQMLKTERQVARPRIEIKRKLSLENWFLFDDMSLPSHSQLSQLSVREMKCREEEIAFYDEKDNRCYVCNKQTLWYFDED